MGLWLLTTFVTMIQCFSVANEFNSLRRSSITSLYDGKIAEAVTWEEWTRNLWLISGILFLCFLWRGTKNLISTGIATKRSAGWSVGGWFIPIGFFWIPYQTVKELIETRPNASDPYGPNDTTNMAERNAKYWLGIWIVAIFAMIILPNFIIDVMLENAESKIDTFKDFTEESSRIWNYIGFSYLIQTVLIIAYLFVVKTISERQDD